MGRHRTGTLTDGQDLICRRVTLTTACGADHRAGKHTMVPAAGRISISHAISRTLRANDDAGRHRTPGHHRPVHYPHLTSERPSSSKRAGKYSSNPQTNWVAVYGGNSTLLLCRTTPTDGRAKTTHAGRLIRAALFAAPRGIEQQAKQPARARCRPALHTKGSEGTTARQRRSERTRQIHQPQGGRHPDQLAESSHPKGKRGPSGITSAAPLKPNGGLPPWKPTGTPLPEGDPHGYQTQRLPTQTHRP